MGAGNQLSVLTVTPSEPMPAVNKRLMISTIMKSCSIGNCSYGRLYVPSDLKTDAPLMFVGEGPSWREVQEGRPFVGPAGKVLDEVLTRIGISRKEISVANLCCCMDTTREKKNPIAEEIDRCAPRLHEEIEIAAPRVIVLLGNLPMAQFYPGVSTISKVRGQPRVWQDRIVISTFHPARALANRNPEAKELIYEDLMTARSLL